MSKNSDSLRRIGFVKWFDRRVALDGNSRAGFIEKMNISKGRVTQLLKGPDPFGETAASNIEEVYELPAGYFLTIGKKIEAGTLSELDLSAGHLADAPAFEGEGDTVNTVTTCTLPLLSWGEVHLMSEDSNSPLLLNIDKQAVYEAKRGTRSKLVKMPDDSLGPRILKGDLLEFDPDLPPSAGRIVVLRSTEGIHAIRRYDALFVAQHNLTVIAACIRWHPAEEQ